MADKILQSVKFPGLNDTYINTPVSIAQQFDETTAYAVEDLVYYNRKLWRFTSAHAAGAWDASHVTETTVEAELGRRIALSDVQVNGVSVVNNGVVNIPKASNDTLGTIIVGNGLNMLPSGRVVTYYAGSTLIKEQEAYYNPITPHFQHESVFYGLAKASGDTTQSSSSNAVGTYTNEAKAAIKSMLGVNDVATDVTISETTPTITALANTRYICGEVTSISFTPCASGICDVQFTSGSTIAVLTLPSTVKMPDWFDASSLETNTIYEIMITDGVWGCVNTWTL